MKALKKISALFSLSLVLFLNLAPAVHAQSVLDDIKGRLGEEGITVVDYSQAGNTLAENPWGGIPDDWQNLLSGSFSGVQDIAEGLKDFYVAKKGIGENKILNLRSQIALLVAQKSSLTLDSKINDIDEQIDALTKDLDDLTEETHNEIKEQITEAIGDNDIIKLLEQANPNFLDEGANLIFAEVNYYYSYSKWGNLPDRIVGVLEAYTEYKSLTELAEDFDFSTELAEDFDFSTEEGIIETIETLQEVAFDEENNITLLSRDDIELIINRSIILSSSGEAQAVSIGRAVANTIKNLAGGLAVIWIVIAGMRMIFAQGDENIITEQKRALLYGVIGLMSILMIDRLIDVMYGPAGVARDTLIAEDGSVIGAQAFSQEVYGVVNFIKALLGTIAILFIVISGIRMIFAAGTEDQITNQRKALLWIGVGLIMIAIDQVIVEQFFITPTQEQSDQLHTTNIASIIDTIGSVLQFVLGFVGVITFGALIYGAATMIMNYGNDEMVEKSKKIIRNAIIGIIVILSAYTIVASLVVFQ